MTYAAVETSDYTGQPVELYRFTLGLQKWLYTSSDVAVVYLTETYEPYPLKRSNFRQTQELSKSDLRISAPRDLPFVASRMANPMQGVVQLTVYRRHRADAEMLTWWKGRVEGIRFAGGEATISCVPLGTSLRRIGLRRAAQRQCDHALYGPGCGVSEASFGVSGSLVSYVGASFTSGVFASHADGWWVGGKIRFGEELRFIVAHAGDTIVLTSAIPGLAQNAAFTVYPGCDHLPGTCDTKFGNILNSAGALWFPIKNPFTGDSAF